MVSFSYAFAYLFRDRFLIVLGLVLGSILEPLGFPSGVYFEGVWGVWFWVDFGMVSGGPWQYPASAWFREHTPPYIMADPGYRIQDTTCSIQDTGIKGCKSKIKRMHRTEEAGCTPWPLCLVAPTGVGGRIQQAGLKL